MKLPTYILLCLFLCSCGQPNNNNNNNKEKTTINQDSATHDENHGEVNPDSDTTLFSPQTVSDIKHQYALVNGKLQQGRLDSVSFKYDCNGERNGTATYFSEKGKLVVIKHSYNEYSHFSAIDLYFVNNTEPFFVHFNRVSWSFESNGTAEGATKDNITEQRFYIAKQKPLLCLEKKYSIRSHSDDNPQPANVASKEVKCGSLAPTLAGFTSLIEFKNSETHDCLKK